MLGRNDRGFAYNVSVMELSRRDREVSQSSEPSLPVQAKAARGPSSAAEAPADAGPAAEGAAGDAGPAGEAAGPAEGAGTWHADAELMSAMGLGEQGAEEVAPGEAGAAPRGKAAAPAPGKEKDKTRKRQRARGQGGGDAAEVPAGEGGGAGGGPVQRAATVGGAPVGAVNVQAAAERGIAGGGGSLPHLDTIQASFGRHDVTGVSAHTDSAAAAASTSMGAEAYATGNHVAFGSASPSLHTAAHEAAHVVQQRAGAVQLKGGVGQVGDVYEQHADAVAELVVAGHSAEGALDQMAPGGGGGAAGVQRKAIQLDIKADLRAAMDGWGTDEDAIFRRCERATAAEARSVLADAALMNELRGELDRGDMTRVLDGLQAPLADKLRLAMQGWGTDEDYIHRVLLQASAADLAAVANDDALVRQLEGELSGEDLRQVLDRLNVPLARKLRMAVRGWGTDEEYIFRSITAATGADCVAVANDAALIALVDADLGGDDLDRWRGTLARKIFVDAGNAPLAWRMIRGPGRSKRAARLRWVGDVAQQRALMDAVITAGADVATVVEAFESYWDVDLSTDGGTWTVAQLQTAHTQCKNLPEQDVRSGVWRRFVSIAGSGGSMSSSGEFRMGAAAAGTQPYGVGTELTAGTAVNATEIFVQDPAVFATGATIAVERGTANADVVQISAVDAAAKKYTLATGLAHAHGVRAAVTPDDGTAVRQVDWVSAVVRHEIAHSVETAMGGVTGFTQGLGGWWSGDSFDTWANAMGSPWATNDGSTISDAEKRQIKDHIVDQMKTRGESGQAIETGLATDHAIVKYLNKGVPVIEAAKPCVAVGQRYWQSPESVWTNGPRRFAINFYYKNFQYYNEVVHAQRVRSYSIFAPAEFFAEVYTVFYEQAGSVPDADLGALVPNAGWRDWIRTNVHNRGLVPRAPGSGTGGPALPTASVGVAAGNPGA